MKAKEYYEKATENAKDFKLLVKENNLELSIIKLMEGYKSHKNTLTDEELDKIDRSSIRNEPSWGEINGY
jgi:hypothetical protein